MIRAEPPCHPGPWDSAAVDIYHVFRTDRHENVRLMLDGTVGMRGRSENLRSSSQQTDWVFHVPRWPAFSHAERAGS